MATKTQVTIAESQFQTFVLLGHLASFFLQLRWYTRMAVDLSVTGLSDDGCIVKRNLKYLSLGIRLVKIQVVKSSSLKNSTTKIGEFAPSTSIKI